MLCCQAECSDNLLQGEDYIEQERFMQDFQQVNRLAGMIHRGVSIAQVPLSQIPPRALMAQSELFVERLL